MSDHETKSWTVRDLSWQVAGEMQNNGYTLKRVLFQAQFRNGKLDVQLRPRVGDEVTVGDLDVVIEQILAWLRCLVGDSRIDVAVNLAEPDYAQMKDDELDAVIYERRGRQYKWEWSSRLDDAWQLVPDLHPAYIADLVNSGGTDARKMARAICIKWLEEHKGE